MSLSFLNKSTLKKSNEISTSSLSLLKKKNLKDDSANFTIVMSLVIHNFIYNF